MRRFLTGTWAVLTLFVLLGLLQGSLAVELSRVVARNGAASGEVAVLIGVFNAGCALGVFGLGRLAGRLPPVVGLRFSLVVLGLGTLLAVVSPDIKLAYGPMFLAGLGSGMLGLLLNAVSVSGDRAASMTFANLGNGCFSLGTVPGPFLASAVPVGYLWVLPALMGGLFLAHWRAATGPVRDALPTRTGEPGVPDVPNALHPGRRRSNNRWLLPLGFFVYGGMEALLSGLLPQHLLRLGLPVQDVGLAVSGFWASLAVSRLLASVAGRRLVPYQLLIFLAVAGLASLSLLDSPTLAVVGGVLVGAAIGPMVPTGLAWAKEIGLDGSRGVSLLICCLLAGASAWPLTAGTWLTASQVPTWAFPACEAALLGLYLVAISALAMHGRRARRDPTSNGEASTGSPAPEPWPAVRS